MTAFLDGLFAAFRRAISACTASYFSRLTMIFNEAHGKLACILDGLAVDKILPEGLLHQHIAAVFFILQDAADAVDGPLR